MIKGGIQLQMERTKPRLRRPCDKCQEYFEPSGPFCKICPDCKGKWSER